MTSHLVYTSGKCLYRSFKPESSLNKLLSGLFLLLYYSYQSELICAFNGKKHPETIVPRCHCFHIEKIKPPSRLAANKTKPLQQGGYLPVCFTLPSSAKAGGLQSTTGAGFPSKECWIIKTAMSRTRQYSFFYP